ncbi:MAG TPA: M3 family metallopeptidase [Candidatus Limnocylindria bacterium]|nr:M3 family metallopeptidase [Candidatus Limnocylindria bacterium]
MTYDYRQVTADSVAAETDAALDRAEELIRRTVASASAPSFAETMVPLELAGAAIAEGYGRGAFMAHVHPESAVRDVGREAEERITKWRMGLAFRDDLYAAVRALADSDEASGLEGEARRLVDHWLRDFRRAGQELPAERRHELEALRNRLVELEVAFSRNIAEFDDGIEVTREQLAGLPDTYIERLRPGAAAGTFRVSLDYPEITPFMQSADDRSLREQLMRKNWNAVRDQNRPLLEEALGIRRQIAALLGTPTWAHFAMEPKMADPDRVAAFYAELVPPIREQAAREAEAMQRRMAAQLPDARLETWDWLYYDMQQQREEHGVDTDEIADYLPLDHVWQGLFEITGEVLGLDYRRVDDARGWHPDVTLYEIRDRSSGDVIAHFYADLFPREGKYSHAAAFPLVMGHRRADGSYATPVNAIVANLTPPAGERPALLRHGPRGEIETLFHEFGHILHMSLTRAEYARFSGAETEWDFVEAPSQIMEHWSWQPELIRRLSKHFRTGEQIPDRLVDALVGSRYINVGLRYARQIWFGTLDLAMHSATDEVDLDQVVRDAYAVTALPYPEDTFYIASFGHLMGGYDAGYYGYLWAEVIGDDMFGRFASEGLLSSEVGGQYRREILEPNGTRDANEMVRAFLGREPTNEAFRRLRGLPVD